MGDSGKKGFLFPASNARFTICSLKSGRIGEGVDMSKLMIILGIIVAAAGAVVGALIYVSPGQMQVLGLTPEVPAILLVSGFSLVGLGGVIGAADRNTAATRGLRDWLAS